MKAITLWQPWASLVALGVKTIETRAWSTSYRGPLAIHAAQGERWRHGQRFGDWLAYRTSKTHPARIYNRDAPPLVRGLPLGAVVATCTLTDVVPTEECIWIPDDGIAGGERHWGVGDNCAAVIEAEKLYGNYAPGRFAWLFNDIEHLAEPVLARGRQGLWEWSWDPTDEYQIDPESS